MTKWVRKITNEQFYPSPIVPLLVQIIIIILSLNPISLFFKPVFWGGWHLLFFVSKCSAISVFWHVHV